MGFGVSGLGPGVGLGWLVVASVLHWAVNRSAKPVVGGLSAWQAKSRTLD